jgi:hypothetical protein
MHPQPCGCEACIVERMTTLAPAQQRAQRALNKRNFIETYVLNRASGHSGGMDGDGAVQEAVAAWNRIEQECAP